MKINFKELHLASAWHEKEILESRKCGCFYCLSIFSPNKIEEWIEESKDSKRGLGKTAMCPNCGIDSVLPDSINQKITIELLKTMKEQYF